MMDPVDDLVVWLGHVLDDLERVAKDAAPGPWELSDRGWQLRLAADEPHFERIATIDQPSDPQYWALRHAENHSPEQTLLDVEATRRLVELHGDQHDCVDPSGAAHPYEGCETLRLVAARFSGWPAYRDEWRPTGG